jgi:hypothetical protein
MYSIFRFTIERGRMVSLEQIGLDMNSLIPGIYQGPRRAGDGFACDLSSSKDWRDHQKATTDFVNTFQGHIRQAQAIGARATVDMALGAEDLGVPIKGLHFGPEFMRLLSANAAALEVTIYTGAPFPTEAPDRE